MSDIQIALNRIKNTLPVVERYCNYYDGNQKLNFASDRFENTFGKTVQSMRDNLCPIVVDAPADRMEVINFAGDESEKQIAEDAWAIWQRELLELTSSDVHKNALKTGAAYLIVWQDEEGRARFYPQDSRLCTLITDEDTGTPLYGAKQWLAVEKFIRLTLYYPDRVEKYITAKKWEGGSDLKASAFIPINIEGEEPLTYNPYGIIPLFKFDTLPVLSDIIPLQDALNKTLADKLVTMEFAAFPQRYATGLGLPTDEITGAKKLPFRAGIDRLWVVEEGEGVKFGEFTAAGLEPFLKVADSYRLEMARVSGTPLHFFSINTSDAISGEALKTLESRFTKKVKRLCLNFGAVWSRAMKLALAIENKSVPENLTVQWAEPEQRSEKEFLETLLLKQDLGVPNDTLLEEAGYTEEDIAKFNAADDGIDPAVKDARQMAATK